MLESVEESASVASPHCSTSLVHRRLEVDQHHKSFDCRRSWLNLSRFVSFRLDLFYLDGQLPLPQQQPREESPTRYEFGGWKMLERTKSKTVLPMHEASHH